MMDPAPFASSPCQLAEDAETRRDVMRWRKAERTRLIAMRQTIPVAVREAEEARIIAALAPEQGDIIAIYWPFRGEPDLRGWAQERRRNGARIVLPVVTQKAQPLEFRLWDGSTKLARGVWDIPVPAEGADVLVPDLIVAPVVGVDPENYRLGYGGGFYDRTLAQLRASAHACRCIGVGFGCQRLATIFPLPHDIAMDHVILS